MNASAIFIFSPTSFLCLVVIEIEANIHTQKISSQWCRFWHICVLVGWWWHYLDNNIFYMLMHWLFDVAKNLENMVAIKCRNIHTHIYMWYEYSYNIKLNIICIPTKWVWILCLITYSLDFFTFKYCNSSILEADENIN